MEAHYCIGGLHWMQPLIKINDAVMILNSFRDIKLAEVCCR